MSELETKVHLLEFCPDETYQHIDVIHQENCHECKNKPCLTVCPTGVFTWDHCDSDPVLVFYKQCVECGACRLACPYENIDFTFPQGGCGIAYHEG